MKMNCNVIMDGDLKMNGDLKINGDLNMNGDVKMNGSVKMNGTKPGVFKLHNPFLNREDDFLYHLGLGVKTHDLPAMFGDVRFVCMGGCARRMEEFAHHMILTLGVESDGKLVNLAEKGHRFVLYKIGPVLSVSHGMGLPSITILLNEIIKLMDYACAIDPVFFRIGTSGGIGIPEGTVVVTSEAVNDYLEPYYELPMLTKRVKRPALIDQELVNALMSMSSEMKKYGFTIIKGKTMSSDHFYECSGINTGAICEYTESDRMEYYKLLMHHKVINMDMEVVALAALTHAVGIQAAAVNVVSNDQLRKIDERFSEEVMIEWQRRPQIIVGQYIKNALKKSL